MAESEARSPLRLAMWSGPRNVSSALMRSWENRGDTVVCDEPFYAHYLERTGLPHPGAAEIIAHHENDWEQVVAELVGAVPDGKAIYYQKHMTHHLLPHMEGDWLDHLTHCFLIRHPKDMLLSLEKILDEIGLDDTGLPQQERIFRRAADASGEMPCVIDSRDLLDDPARILALLCERLGISFTERMLSWPPGKRETDGIWAKHWYGSVERSTEFLPFSEKSEKLPGRLEGIYESCLEIYQSMYPHRIT